MDLIFGCDRQAIPLRVPADALVYESHFAAMAKSPAELVRAALGRPRGGKPLAAVTQGRRKGEVVIVVSDITRPIPYATFLPELLGGLEGAGVPREQILILIATGMHRRSTEAERRTILGNEVAARYRIEDHDATAADLIELPEPTWSGARVRLNRRFVQAGLRIITGLVEPHFMAGFSGGRKAVCPGLADLGTLRNFHGAKFLADGRACGGNLTGNPLHQEALSVARQIGVDFSLNVVLDKARRVVGAFAGELAAAHEAACGLAAECTCRKVAREADVVITSSGGYPLDATFYQCVKGFVGCLPAVKKGGKIIALGGCAEGIGSPEYAATMREYAGRWTEFLRDIEAGRFVKDQWQFQMHCRTLAKIGVEGLEFVTAGLDAATLGKLSVAGHAVPAGQIAERLQERVDRAVLGGKTVAVFPEGPYCAAT